MNFTLLHYYKEFYYEVQHCGSESINNVKSKMVNKIIIGLCGHKSEVLLTHKKNEEKWHRKKCIVPTYRPIPITASQLLCIMKFKLLAEGGN